MMNKFNVKLISTSLIIYIDYSNFKVYFKIIGVFSRIRIGIKSAEAVELSSNIV